MSFAIFTMLGDLLTDWIKGRQQIQQKKVETKLAVEDNKARLAADEQKYNNSWEMAQLTDCDKVTRRISFICFTAPFVVAIFFPEAVKEYFTTAIAAIPDWYKVTYMTITGAVWGVSSLKNPVSEFLNIFKK